ncbi:SGNH/GDSL hydrolase family protein [Solitalea koreensis]|uniref:Lysophospholipase L1 n=1 Tax=Solitalea koreensis TaxID=543615 RepID=A0A521CL29_9SPHI|nr:SGNH/GDSL hydrolase family protein [Solitalea koreensis]SMO60163.1 Lysophospholipase L1 [Solitalea koreensis]
MTQHTFTYLALGDSYTIGEAVEEKDRYPVQLVDLLNQQGIHLNLKSIIATTGWTTDELIADIKQAKPEQTFDIVTLLIGVNNQYRRRSIDAYRHDFRRLLRIANKLSGGNKKQVFVLSIPDWSVAPFANDGRDKQVITDAINKFNAVNKEETLNFGVHYINITPTSYLATADDSYIAPDNLHFSGKMYKKWAELLEPVVKSELEKLLK